MTGKIRIYDKTDLAYMKKACTLARNVLDFIEPYVQIGIETIELDRLCQSFIESNNAVSATLNYNGFPNATCISVNQVVCHGIPGPYKLKSGDIVNIDVSVIVDGWFGDTSRTFIVGQPTMLAAKLVAAAQKALEIGIKSVGPGGFFGDIGYAIQTYIESQGFSVVRDYCGHGIGRSFHEAPSVLHYGLPKTGERILPGMFFTIEPMINVSSHKTKVLKDGWTAVTIDKLPSAQFEHTIAITDNEALVLT
jgi:methionyl aminopeptidase